MSSAGVSRRLGRCCPDQLDPADITLSGQDWGGFVFLVHVGLTPDRFAAVVAANSGMARVPGAQRRDHVTAPDAGHLLQKQQPDLLVDAILSLG